MQRIVSHYVKSADVPAIPDGAEINMLVKSSFLALLLHYVRSPKMLEAARISPAFAGPAAKTLREKYMPGLRARTEKEGPEEMEKYVVETLGRNKIFCSVPPEEMTVE